MFPDCLKRKFVRFYHLKNQTSTPLSLILLELMQTLRLLAHAFVLLLAVSGLARAAEGVGATSPKPGDTDNITIDADVLEVYLDRKMSAIGDAELHHQDQSVYGDRIDYDLINEELHVSGNGRLEQGNNSVIGPEMRIKLDSREGEMRDPVFTMRNVQTPGQPQPGNSAAIGKAGYSGFSRVSAKSVVFDGPEREHFNNARFTTCPAGVDDWYLRAKELEVDHSTDTVTARHASVEFKGVPILYAPWMDFSFNNQRKSGFLAPYYGTGNLTGFEFSAPYYWNIAPNMDATITPRYMSKRGLQTRVEFRYLEPNFQGINNVEYLAHDSSTGTTRYLYDLRHQHNFGNGWSGSYLIDRVSDDKYFSDMSTYIGNTSQVVLPQEGRLNYSGTHLGAAWNFNTIVQQFQTLNKQSYPYYRLPEFNLRVNREWDKVSANIFSQWVRFEQDSKAPDRVTGNRFATQPSLSFPMATSYGYVTPKIALWHTRYDLGGNTTIPGSTQEYQSTSVTVPIFSVDTGVYFDRNFRVVKNRYTQTLEPRLFYVYIPYQNQSDLPVFDSGQADLNMTTLFTENQFTGFDRINNANQVSFALTSRLIDDKTGVQRLVATVGQRYYFVDQKVTIPGTPARNQNNSDIYAAISAELLTHWRAYSVWQYNTDTSKTYRSNLGARYNPGDGRLLNASYRFTQDSVEQLDFSGRWPLGSRWWGLGRWNYSMLSNQTVEGIAGAEYDAGCWQVRTVAHRLVTPTAGTSTSYFVQLELGGLVPIGTSPFRLLRRSISGYGDNSMIADPVEEEP